MTSIYATMRAVVARGESAEMCLTVVVHASVVVFPQHKAGGISMTNYLSSHPSHLHTENGFERVFCGCSRHAAYADALIGVLDVDVPDVLIHIAAMRVVRPLAESIIGTRRG